MLELIKNLEERGYKINTIKHLYEEYVVTDEGSLLEENVRGMIVGYLCCLKDNQIISDEEGETAHMDLICNRPQRFKFII